MKNAVKRGLTQRLRQRVGMGDSDSSDEERGARRGLKDLEETTEDGETTLRGDGAWEQEYSSEKPRKAKSCKRGGKVGKSLETGVATNGRSDEAHGREGRKTNFHLLPKAAASMTSMSMLEQSMPADAVLAREGANEVRKRYGFYVHIHFFGTILTFTSISSYKTLILLLCLWALSRWRMSLKVNYLLHYFLHC